MFSKKGKNKKAIALKFSVPSIIVSDLNISGDLVSDGAIEIGGKVYGNIRCNIVTIRKGALVKGDIVANELNVQGRVEGLIKARSVNLSGTAEVVGEVVYSYLSIEAGANIDGSCKKDDKEDFYGSSSESEQLEYIPSIAGVLNEDSNNSVQEDNNENSLPSQEESLDFEEEPAGNDNSQQEIILEADENLFEVTEVKDKSKPKSKSKLKKS